MSLRRYASIAPSKGTTWPPEVRAHVETHQPPCLGPLAGMPEPCAGQSELDHIRASGGIGMKSKSVAVNAARMCGIHHRRKTDFGRQYRPKLLQLVGLLHGDCARCQDESMREYGVPLEREHNHVDPVYGCRDCPVSVQPL